MRALVLSAVSVALIAAAGFAGAAGSPPVSPVGPASHPEKMRGHGHGWGDAIGPIFKALDADGDGKISRAEIQAAGNSRFDAADTNRDGKLSQVEIDAARQAARAERKAAMFKRWDKDGDGVLSKEESIGRALERFDAVDTDHDGTISEDERKAARSAWRSKRMERVGNR